MEAIVSSKIYKKKFSQIVNNSLNISCFWFSVVANVSDEEMQEHYDNFFEDVFVECEDRYGEIEEMNVCDNLGDHLVGNVYIKVNSLFPNSFFMLLNAFDFSSVVKKTPNVLPKNWIIVGLAVVQFMPNYHQLLISVKHVAVNMRWANVRDLVFAISCIWNRFPEICAGKFNHVSIALALLLIKMLFR